MDSSSSSRTPADAARHAGTLLEAAAAGPDGFFGVSFSMIEEAAASLTYVKPLQARSYQRRVGCGARWMTLVG